MQLNHQSTTDASNAPFQLEIFKPYSTFNEDGTATPTNFIAEGLFTAGGVSILGAKPKVGKSSLSRYLAVCVASGEPFLNRKTSKGDVMLISLEDSRSHVDNCLGALGYDPDSHSQIHIVERVSHDPHETVQAIRCELARMPDVKLIIVDHLAHFLNAKDLNDYMPVHRGFNLLRELTKDFPHVHVLCLAHAKKAQCDDPFDTILGTTALRGMPDCNVVLLNEQGGRVIVSETRIGRAIPATILKTRMVTSAGSDVVSGYTLGESFNQWDADKKHKAEMRQAEIYTSRIVDFLADSEGQTALHKEVVKQVTGKTERIVDAIKTLEDDGIISASGTPRELHLNLEGEALSLYRMSQQGKRK